MSGFANFKASTWNCFRIFKNMIVFWENKQLWWKRGLKCHIRDGDYFSVNKKWSPHGRVPVVQAARDPWGGYHGICNLGDNSSYFCDISRSVDNYPIWNPVEGSNEIIALRELYQVSTDMGSKTKGQRESELINVPHWRCIPKCPLEAGGGKNLWSPCLVILHITT